MKWLWSKGRGSKAFHHDSDYHSVARAVPPKQNQLSSGSRPVKVMMPP